MSRTGTVILRNQISIFELLAVDSKVYRISDFKSDLSNELKRGIDPSFDGIIEIGHGDISNEDLICELIYTGGVIDKVTLRSSVELDQELVNYMVVNGWRKIREYSGSILFDAPLNNSKPDF